MGKICKEELEIAATNGISKSAVYRRVNQKGWTVWDAITTSTNPGMIEERKKSILFSVKLGKIRQCQLPSEIDEALDLAIEASGLTEKDYLSELILRGLKNEKVL
jgi:predicted DNA-binding transcriptional regulator AlpA